MTTPPPPRTDPAAGADGALSPAFLEHRRRFIEVLAREEAVAVVPSGALVRRSHDCEHRFRPRSDFYWLTGFDEPDAWLVLQPQADDDERVVLFLRPRDPEQETWTGRRLGVDAAPEALGVDEAHPVAELGELLPGMLVGARRLVWGAGEDEARDRAVIAAARASRGKARGGAAAPVEWIDPSVWLHELRLVKDADELDRMRRAAAVSREAHRLVMAAARPGRNEAELDALLEWTFRRRGCTGSSYTNIVAGGANACILHYVENRAELRAGELCLVDAGAEWSYYASDVTRTFPVDGRFTPEQRELYDLVLRAQRAAIAEVLPGKPFTAAHEAAVRELSRGLLELGLLSGTLDEVLEKERYRRFYMHRTGHWLGLDVHDCGSYWETGGARRLAPGMVTTVEPGLYVGPEDSTVDARWRGIGIRIEDDLLVTAEGHEVLSAGVPKELDEVEAACDASAREPGGVPAPA